MSLQPIWISGMSWMCGTILLIRTREIYSDGYSFPNHPFFRKPRVASMYDDEQITASWWKSQIS
jgi:hypothetical protein